MALRGHSSAGPERLGRYVIERRIGVGGMAEVFLGHLEGPGRFQKQVVIKRLLKGYEDDDYYVKMFFDEARLAARFSHPNLVAVQELFDADNCPAMAMEYVRGLDVSTLLSVAKASKRQARMDTVGFVWPRVKGPRASLRAGLAEGQTALRCIQARKDGVPELG